MEKAIVCIMDNDLFQLNYVARSIEPAEIKFNISTLNHFPPSVNPVRYSNRIWSDGVYFYTYVKDFSGVACDKWVHHATLAIMPKYSILRKPIISK